MTEPERNTPKVTLVDAAGLQPSVSADDVLRRLEAKSFFWVDICGATSEAMEYLRLMGMNEPEIAWALKFGQAGRLRIEPHCAVRAVTSLAAPGPNLVEVHVWSSLVGILTIWNGESAALDGVRQRFAERVAGIDEHPYQAAGLVLGLLLSTIDQAIGTIDERIAQIRDRIRKQPDGISLDEISQCMETLRESWLKVDRYAIAVRSANVGVENIAGMTAQGLKKLSEYEEDVEDIEQRLRERFERASSVMQDYSAAVASRQADQINRLTVISLIFLPISFLTGYFGMNFTFMTNLMGGATIFFALGVLLPVACVILTLLWLRDRGLI